jgi:peptide/nickel transport system substrate-binding protein
MLGQTDLLTGGTLGDLPFLRAAEVPNAQVVLDPVRGLSGLAFARSDGLLADAPFRQALSMSIDRDALAARFGAPGLQPRLSILPGGLSEVPQPALPEWSAVPLVTRRELATRIVAELTETERPRIRVAVPDGLGYRIAFAHIRRDWRFIGVDAIPVAAGAEADLRLIDEVAPADLAPWYLRHLLCGASPICDESADLALEGARVAATPAERQTLLIQADQSLNRITAFIPIASPVRWSLRSQRLNGFRPNVFGRHALTELIQARE